MSATPPAGSGPGWEVAKTGAQALESAAQRDTRTPKDCVRSPGPRFVTCTTSLSPAPRRSPSKTARSGSPSSAPNCARLATARRVTRATSSQFTLSGRSATEWYWELIR